MTRQECEQAIVKKLREIWDIYQRYYPGGKGLSLLVAEDCAGVYNTYWDERTERKLDHFEMA